MHSRTGLLGAITLTLFVVCHAHADIVEREVLDGWMGPHQPNTWIAQLDMDPQLEMIMARTNGTGTEVFIFDGVGGTELQESIAVADGSGGIASIVADIDNDGKLEVLVASASADGFARTMVIDTDAAAVAVPYAPTGSAMRLEQSRPNPTSGVAVIDLSLEREDVVRLLVFNVAGQLVRTLLDGERLGAGPHAIRWDGKDEAGRQVASGTYFYRVEGTGFSAAKKAVVLR